jgi:hypothetical protein
MVFDFIFAEVCVVSIDAPVNQNVSIIPRNFFFVLLQLFTILTDSQKQDPSREADSHSVKKFPAFYETQRFIIVFTRTRHWYISWFQSTPSHAVSLTYILILSSHLRLDLVFSNQTIVHIFCLSHAWYISRPSHLPLFDLSSFYYACLYFYGNDL